MSRMMNIREVRDYLDLSYFEVIRMVQTGRLRAYRYAGTGVLNRDEVTENTTGLRFKESDVEEMLENSLVS